MIAATLLPEVLEQVTRLAGAGPDALVVQLRLAHPGVHFSVCSDDDIPPRLSPAAGNGLCHLYYVASGEHCLSLTTDAEAATGLVVGLCDGEDE
ncbi:MAG: DUF6129 family protein [Rhodocyclaceae bacterium]|nr:DUF6129 family protein [Rhodocyclaceae bacterium]